MECADWFKPVGASALSWRFQFLPNAWCVCRVAVSVNTSLVRKDKERWEMGGKPTNSLCGFSSFLPPQQGQGEFPQCHHCCPAVDLGHRSFLLCPTDGQESLLSPVLHIHGHPWPVQMDPSLGFLQGAFQKPSVLRELPILWLHKWASRDALSCRAFQLPCGN